MTLTPLTTLTSLTPNKSMLSRSIIVFYVSIITIMSAATITEKYRGSDFVADAVYGSWWFAVMWALLAAAGVAYIVKRRIRRASVLLLHGSFVVILLGALLTHVSASQGTMRLRLGETTDTYEVNSKDGKTSLKLPFKLRLKSFDIRYHEGTTAAADYVTQITLTDGDKTIDGEVSMNNVFSYKSVRFYQMSYYPDMRGSVLAVNRDPWGIPVTYCGYALLFIAVVWMLIDPKGPYRRLLRSDIVRKGMMTFALLAGTTFVAHGATTLPKETADRFGRLYVLYNNRVCPLQTLAIDFTKKLCGSSSYGGYTPEQVLMGFVMWPDEWSREPLLRLKGGALRDRLQLPERCSVNTFFNDIMGGYIIGPYLNEYYNGNNDEFHRQVADVDARIQLVMDLRRGKLLKVFPYTCGGKTTWYAPTDNMPDSLVDPVHRQYMQNVFSLIYQEALAGNMDSVDNIAGKMLRYQQKNGGSSLPSDVQTRAERLYNAVPFATILFMLNLFMGFATLFAVLWLMTRPVRRRLRGSMVMKIAAAVMLFSFAALTLCVALRWMIRGTVPMANGYETMLLMAWIIMAASLLLCRRFAIVLTFGFIMSGFFLLVSHISQMDPQITHIMPVLASPLLSIHVSVIMAAFALLSLTFVCGLMALLLRCVMGRRAPGLGDRLYALRALSQLFYYPALAALAVGIFVGAVWANVSWGTYWSWDAKEVWALITFMVYAVAAHRVSLPFMRGPMAWHVFMVAAFATILMTYFGVNYFLGGMHSYA